MMYPLVRELAGDGIPLTLTCRALKIARQPYYRWLVAPVGKAELQAAYRADALFDAHRDDPQFGYRFLVDEAGDAGEPMSARTAWRICQANRWWSMFGKKRGKNGKKPGPPVHHDLCAGVVRHGVTWHVFTAAVPNELWLADITEHWTSEGRRYVCAVKDACSDRIVGYSIDSRMKSPSAVAGLDNAVAPRGAAGVDVAGCILDTDRGSEFRARKHVRALHRHGMVGSVCGVGAAGDKRRDGELLRPAPKNVLNQRCWNAREQLRIAIVTWIERTYHRRRRQGALGKLTPIESQTIITTPAGPAA